MAEDDADEALHVAGAAPEELAVANARLEGVARPGLPVDGHDIRMTGEDEAARTFTEAREHIGLLPIGAPIQADLGAVTPRDAGAPNR